MKDLKNPPMNSFKPKWKVREELRKILAASYWVVFYQSPTSKRCWKLPSLTWIKGNKYYNVSKVKRTHISERISIISAWELKYQFLKFDRRLSDTQCQLLKVGCRLTMKYIFLVVFIISNFYILLQYFVCWDSIMVEVMSLAWYLLGHNASSYDYSKNRFFGCDVEVHKNISLSSLTLIDF